MPARRRTSPGPVTRRPRVAGTAVPGRPETEGEGPTLTGVRAARPAARPAVPVEPRTQPEVANVADVADVVAGESEPATDADAPVDLAKATPRGRRSPVPDEAEPIEPAERGSSGRGSALLARLRTVPVLAAALVVLVALAAFSGFATASLRGTPAAANTALTDLAATSEVSTQLGDALETLYSYDFARLDENERAARGVITDAFAPEFDRLFAQVRELAPQQQAVVSAVVNVSAVQRIDGDTAVLVAFMDQQATTAASAEQVAAAGRLTVTGERVDGRWRIAAVESR